MSSQAALARFRHAARWSAACCCLDLRSPGGNSDAPRLRRDQRGAVALIAALAMTILCGVVGLAIDVGLWYRTTRAMQNAADAAAIAAARDGTSTFQNTGKAIAARYGFVDGTDGISIVILANQTCPSGSTSCYRATINDAAGPQFFSKVLGVPAPPLSSAAVVDSTAGGTLKQYCMLALAGSGANPAVLTNGAPKADMSGCDIMSNTGMTCHGHNLNADSGDAAGTNNGCGNVQNSNVPKVNDPYAWMATQNIPASTCGSNFPQKPNGNNLAAFITAGGTRWLDTQVFTTSTATVCGDLVLAPVGSVSNVITPPGGTVVFIYNGTLDLRGKTLKATGGGLTLVFTASPAGPVEPEPYPTTSSGNGTLDFAAPTSGVWQGIAIYLDPKMPAQSFTYAGNSPTWNITGLVYMPKTSMTFSGAINKSTTGADCFVLVVDSIRINGTGSILAHGGCGPANVPMPTNTIPGGSPALVL